MNEHDQDWFDLNRAALRAAAEVARLEIAALAAAPKPAKKRGRSSATALAAARDEEQRVCTAVPHGCGLDRVATVLELSPFERRLIAAAASAVIDPAFGATLADLGRSALDFGLALRAFEGAHWTATLPGGPLRSWRVLEPAAGPHLLAAPLVLDERILHLLLGLDETDVRVSNLARRLRGGAPLSRSQETVAQEIAECWDGALQSPGCPAVLLQGASRAEGRAVALAAAAKFGSEAWVVDAAALAGAESSGWRRLWEREALLRAAVLVVEAEPAEAAPPEAQRLAEQLRGPVILAGGRWSRGARARRVFEIAAPSAEDRVAWWREALGEHAAALNGTLEKAALQFRLTPEETIEAGREALADGAAPTPATFWSACRRIGRADLEALAERIEPRARRSDLVLPALQTRVLGDVVAAARQQHTVAERWGFAEKSARGLGLTALFAGPSGTGKTMAAEILAGELGLDLYRIDLSSVVSKYIGETEKNLRRVFDAADHSGALLLFDEADALFGKRSEVRDSHDRYANIEVGYLLQRMEAYRGLAILTTNMRQSLDEAFLRRLRFVVNFPFPDAGARQQIWQHVLPEQTPRGKLDWTSLARLNIAGGSIRNIALGAAVLAAEDGGALEMRHLARAARTECMKLERSLADSELAGWE